MPTIYSRNPDEPMHFHGYRLSAARLLAGLLTSAEGARVLRVKEDSYACNELGWPASVAFLRRAASAFSVSEEFLRESDLCTAQEALAYSVAWAMAEYRDNPLEAKTAGRHIAWMRQSAGYETIEEAASKFRFSPLHARAYELGVRAPQAQELVAFALAYDRDPVGVLAGDPCPKKPLLSWRRRQAEDLVFGRWGTGPEVA